MLLIDRYAYTNKLNDFNPMAKFIFAIGALFLSASVDNHYIHVIVFVSMFFLTTVVAKIPIKNYLKLYGIPAFFMIISILTILITKSYEDIFICSIKLKNSYIGITDESLRISISTISRVLACISSTFFIALTTPINQIIKVFQTMRFPNSLIELIILIYRSIFIFLEESKEIYNAQEMKFGYMGMKNSYRSFSLLIKCLFIRVIFRFKDMMISLDSKLYDGEFKIG